MGPELVIRSKAPAIAHKRPPPSSSCSGDAGQAALPGADPEQSAGTPRVEKASTKLQIATFQGTDHFFVPSPGAPKSSSQGGESSKQQK